MTTSPLQSEFEYYLANQAALVERYNGKYIVIKDRRVLGAYDDQVSAIAQTQKTHELGTFLVQRVAPGVDAHTQTFYSRVAFAR
jgi:hypothetical protein